MSLLAEWFRMFGAYGQFISVLAGLVTFFGYVFQPSADDSIRERIFPGLVVGLAAGHIPAALLLIFAALDPEYLAYLKHQRIQVGLGGAVLLAFVVDRIIRGFREE